MNHFKIITAYKIITTTSARTSLLYTEQSPDRLVLRTYTRTYVHYRTATREAKYASNSKLVVSSLPLLALSAGGVHGAFR